MRKPLLVFTGIVVFSIQSTWALSANDLQLPIGESSIAPTSQNSATATVPKTTIKAVNFKNKLPLDVITSKYIDLKPSQVRAKRGSKEAGIYEKVSPSVVLIVTDDAIGSGSIITKTGAILTNYHVVKGYEYVAVIFKPKDNQKVSKNDVHRAKVIKYDEIKDLAFIKLSSPPKNLKALKLGKKGTIKIGHDVHAIGHPTGENWTYTKGFISQMRNDYEWITELGLKHKANVIQTQTPINPGNSGGPLINDSGELIGINSFKMEGEALNFAVDVGDVDGFIRSKGDTLAEKVESECASEPISSERSEKGDSTYYYYDFDCDEIAESQWEVSDNPKGPSILAMDTTGNGRYDEVYVDETQDGRWDYSLYDTNTDGEPDLIGHHPDGELEASRYEKYS